MDSVTDAVTIGPADAAGRLRLGRIARVHFAWWEIALLAVGTAAAVTSVVITLRADFLVYPGWLSVQKADFILGPLLVGLYWRRARPQSRFGWMLIAIGLLFAPNALEGSANPVAFTIGLYWESVIVVGFFLLVLAFPNGRLRWFPDGLILAAAVADVLVSCTASLFAPQEAPGGSLSACRALCPANVSAVVNRPDLVLSLGDATRWLTIFLAASTAGILIWRFVSGSPPRRRALAIGTPVALLFLLTQLTYNVARLYTTPTSMFFTDLRFVFAIARSLVWYGFLFALIAAQLFAGRTLQRLVRGSLRRPSRPELEAMLREPLGDPTFRLRFWDPAMMDWDGDVDPGAGSAVTVVERDGIPSVALVHDAQLGDDPELLQAAGTVALLAAENAELDAGWTRALGDLRRSRQRITMAVDEERRRVAGNLHDSVQQQLGAIRVHLAMIAADTRETDIQDRLGTLGERVDVAIDEVREVSQQLFPQFLVERGLVEALDRSLAPLRVHHTAVNRHSADVESAVYFCCLEAVQNARKHGGSGVSISVSLREDESRLSFEVTDDGSGFDASAPHDGMGLHNLEDRLGALGGEILIASTPGRGTVVSGFVPLQGDRPAGRGQSSTTATRSA